MDQVAIDSVCFDFLVTEWSDYPRISGAHDYLHEAALANNPPSGALYDPEKDGIALESLGTHEHWNNPKDKQYSRNLGTDYGIELIKPAVINDISGDYESDGDVDFDDLSILAAHWLEKNQTGCIGDLDGDCDVDFFDFSILILNWGKD